MDGENLRFPLTCQYRVIAEKRDGMHFVIETVLMGQGVTAPLRHSRESEKGRYQSFEVEIIVKSLEEMNAIDAALRAIEGVKMVL